MLSEQEERVKRVNNIIVYNLPEFNEETPKSEDDKKEFFLKNSHKNINIQLLL